MYMLTTMRDPRWQQLAKVFCQAVQLKNTDKVLLRAVDLEALPLLVALYTECIAQGATAVAYEIGLPELDKIFFKLAQPHQLAHFPSWDLEQMKQMDVFMAARAVTNGLNLKAIPGKRIAERDRVTEPVLRQRVDHTRWCITYVPTDSDAMLAGMGTSEYLAYYFEACLQDYSFMKEAQQKLVDLMNQTDRVKIIAPGTDLDFSIKGIPAISCYGTYNIPDGEVFTAPVRESINGTVNFNAPSIYNDRLWTNVRLKIKDGKIVEATSDQGSALNEIFDTDAGARYFGEFAIGTNPGIRQPACNILFDEKIHCSFHLTPGSAYKEAYNGNDSAVHWDLVKLLDSPFGGGTILFDGYEVIKDGLFVDPSLLDLNF